MVELPLTEEGGGSFHYLISSSDGCITKKSVPGELVIELLSYLPIKSVCKFRCVSKSWLKLFTNDPFFAKLHLTHQSNESKLHITSFLAKEHHPGIHEINKFHLAETSDNLNFFELPSCLDTLSYYFVHGICNGMVILRSSENLYIWNPLTRDYIHIRCCPPESTIPLGHTRCVNFGFGLNQATNEYKVVRYVGDGDKSDHDKFRSCVSVCTLTSLSREPSWRTIEPFDQYHTLLKDRCTAPLVNGTLHWRAIRIPLPQSRVILSFDLKEEIFKEIPHPFPTELIFKDVYLELVELGGLLCMFGIQYGVELQIWVMKQYGVNGSWTKQFKIGLLGVCGSFEYLQPVGVANSREIILIKCYAHSIENGVFYNSKNAKNVVLYNAETDSVRDVKIFDSGHWQAYTYTGSLISPKFISGLNHNRT